MKKLLYLILSVFFVGFVSCSLDNDTINDQLSENPKTEVNVSLGLSFESFEGQKTKAIADEIKFISLLLFNTTTNQYDRIVSFDVVGSEYMFKIPTGEWTIVLLGTGDGLIADFATPLLPGVLTLSDKMVKVSKDAGVYYNIREYFHAKQTVIITGSSTSIPTMKMKRIVSKLLVQTTPQLSDSLDYVSIELKNAVESVNFLGAKSSTYINQFQERTNTSNGIYDFEFYSLGTKPLGSGVGDFYINMGYRRKATGVLNYFNIFDPDDFQADGLIVNTKTSLIIGI